MVSDTTLFLVVGVGIAAYVAVSLVQFAVWIWKTLK